MADVTLSLARIGLAVCLIALNGFFVAAEFAFVRLRSASVETMVEEGRRGATAVQNGVENLDDYLAVSQLGITISSLGLGWVGEPAVAVLVEPVLSPLLPSGTLHAVSVAIGFGIVTFLHVTYGELAPKTLAIQRAERIALVVAVPMKWCYYLFLPGIVLFNGVANASTRLVGVPPASETDETHTEAEILSILSEAGEAGRVDMEEVRMVERVFDLDDIPVREVMRPRPDVATVTGDTPLADLRSRAIEEAYTRYPIVEEDGQRIVGFVDVKDILRVSDSIDADGEITARDLVRDIVVVPETLPVSDLLDEFQTEQRQMAAVVDERGTFEGLVTVEDVVEVIVGDIRDQFDLDEPAPAIERLDGDGFLVDGEVPLAELNDALDADFESPGVETAGGFVLDRLGRAPEVGDTVETDGYRVRVEEVDGARVIRILVGEDGT